MISDFTNSLPTSYPYSPSLGHPIIGTRVEGRRPRNESRSPTISGDYMQITQQILGAGLHVRYVEWWGIICRLRVCNWFGVQVCGESTKQGLTGIINLKLEAVIADL